MGKRTLFLAAGHGGPDRGNVTRSGVVERDELLAIVGVMRARFAVRGIPTGVGGAVFLDDILDLGGQMEAMKAWKANSADGDLGLDIHLDNKPGDSGALILYDEAPQSKRFAEMFLPRWCAATGIKSNGIHRSAEVAQRWRGWDDYGWCRPRDWSGAVVELGCANNQRDLGAVRNHENRLLAANLIWEVWCAIA